MNKLGSGSFLYADPAVEHEALTEAAHTSERNALAAVREYRSHNGHGDG